MTIREHLMDKVNAYIAKQIWQSISTELNNRVMGAQKGMQPDSLLQTPGAQFAFLIDRADELLKELVSEQEE